MTAADDTLLEAVLWRDRQAVIAGLVAVIALAWIWILLGGGPACLQMAILFGSGADDVAAMMAPARWTFDYAGIMFTMWWVMMAP
jgi:predicted metal-binding membrane protein